MLGEMAARDLGPVLLRDDDHTIRVVLHRPSFADLVDLAVAQSRRYGAADPAVLARLYWLLREIAWTATLPDQHRVVTGQLGRLDATTDAQNFDSTERAELAVLADQVTRGPTRSVDRSPDTRISGPHRIAPTVRELVMTSWPGSGDRPRSVGPRSGDRRRFVGWRR